MTPDITGTSNGLLHESNGLIVKQSNIQTKDKATKPRIKRYERVLVWKNILIFILVHAGGLYGFHLLINHAKWSSGFFVFFFGHFTGMGITAGAHRLWAHRSYKATWQLRLILMIANTIAIQDSVIDWCRDHRVHHKYSDTNADPYNSRRGFFFSHIGWLCVKKHPEVTKKGKGVDLSDLENDPILAFQKRHYVKLIILLSVVLPTVIPMYFWNETFWNAFFLNNYRYAFVLNSTWLVNSAAHMIGNKPYDKNIAPSENWLVSLLANGEGWHNYHHAFPWDYKTAELPYTLNVTSMLIDFCALIGWAYDMKSASPEMIKSRIERTGDGSHSVWGWDDEVQDEEERKQALIYNHREN